jgi:iron(III) transport system substrate-binding protein
LLLWLPERALFIGVGNRVKSRAAYLIICLLAGASSSASLRADTGSPVYYTSSYNDIISAAQREGKLVIYSNLRSLPLENGLLESFRKLYPFIKVTDVDGDGASLSQRFAREIAARQPSADLVLSSAMDLQEKLINDGFARPYASPETAFLPSWAHWKDLGYGATSEPVAFVFDRRFIDPTEMPRTHAGLDKMLRENKQKYHDRVATYDPRKSEVGMLFLSQDVRATPDAWNLFGTFGDLGAHTYSTSVEMLQHLIRGEQWIAYDVIASYAMDMQRKNAYLTIVYPTDYVLTMSRVAFISASAQHPASAKLFLDFLLSRTGQANLGKYGMGSIRTDMDEALPGRTPRTQAIRIGPGLLAGLDSLVREKFFRRWEERNIRPSLGSDGARD